MTEYCLIKKVATVEVYQNKNEVRAYGFMAGDRNTPVMEVKFKHLFGEKNLSECKLRWVIVDDVGSLLVGEVPISSDNTAFINLPNELFNGERRMKVQLTVASCDGERILNLQQFTDLKIINNLAPNEIVEPVYDILINDIYDKSQQYLLDLEDSYTQKYGGLDSLYKTSKASLEEYLMTFEGGNAEFLQGYRSNDFVKTDNGVATGISIKKENPILTFKDTRNEGEKGGVVGCMGSPGRLAFTNTVTNKEFVLDNDGKIRYNGHEVIDLSKYKNSKQETGFSKFPNGFIVQYGKFKVRNSYSGQDIPFPIAFSSTNYSCSFGGAFGTNEYSFGTILPVSCYSKAVYKMGIIGCAQYSSPRKDNWIFNSGEEFHIHWIAIGF